MTGIGSLGYSTNLKWQIQELWVVVLLTDLIVQVLVWVVVLNYSERYLAHE